MDEVHVLVLQYFIALEYQGKRCIGSPGISERPDSEEIWEALTASADPLTSD